LHDQGKSGAVSPPQAEPYLDDLLFAFSSSQLLEEGRLK
jgi:hypothetical protein